MSIFHRALVRALPLVPKPIVGAVAKRYIAGESLPSAIEVAAQLNGRGFMTTLDMLGELTEDAAGARTAARGYAEVFAALERHGIDGNVSVKPSQFGLKVDFELCRDLFRELITAAAAKGYFVRVEMEDSSCTEPTLRLYESLLGEFTNTGIVIQSYLHRSADDARRLAPLAPNVRVVKGVYVEPSSIAYQDRERIRDNYVELCEILLSGGSYVAFATHDDVVIERVTALTRRMERPVDAYEFQMLLGVQERLRQRILDAGERMRVYVPFGSDWYPYSLRRLRENPKIAGYVLAGLLRR